MSEEGSRKRLGRGLAALIGEIEQPATPAEPQPMRADGRVPIELVSPNPRNPRRNFAEAELEDLAQSIREHGIVQPVIVRPAPGQPGQYQIVAGERRWRAAQRAGLLEIPVLIRDVDDRAALELAIIENVQRTDLNPIEEALGYEQLINDHQYTQADLGQVIGKSRSHVANTLRLLKLPDQLRDLLADGRLSAGHARTLVNAADPAALARQILDRGLSVRQAEALAQSPSPAAVAARRAPHPEKDPNTAAVEKQLSDATGMTVSIHHRGYGGDVVITYRMLDQLEELCRRLQR